MVFCKLLARLVSIVKKINNWTAFILKVLDKKIRRVRSNVNSYFVSVGVGKVSRRHEEIRIVSLDKKGRK